MNEITIVNNINNSVNNAAIEEEEIFYPNIYRYKFTEEFMENLYRFSKIHQYDNRHHFKEAWTTWTEENQEMIDMEVKRLLELGYVGDILDKMFKSARYYFRKKSTEKKELKKRKKYVGGNKELIKAMDDHIQENIICDDYKPSDGFLDFCKENKNIVKEEIMNLLKTNIKEKNEIQKKIKKTYKNRYFMLITK